MQTESDQAAHEQQGKDPPMLMEQAETQEPSLQRMYAEGRWSAS
jgi:hypothetical protein